MDDGLIKSQYHSRHPLSWRITTKLIMTPASKNGPASRAWLKWANAGVRCIRHSDFEVRCCLNIRNHSLLRARSEVTNITGGRSGQFNCTYAFLIVTFQQSALTMQSLASGHPMRSDLFLLHGMYGYVTIALNAFKLNRGSVFRNCKPKRPCHLWTNPGLVYAVSYFGKVWPIFWQFDRTTTRRSGLK